MPGSKRSPKQYSGTARGNSSGRGGSAISGSSRPGGEVIAKRDKRFEKRYFDNEQTDTNKYLANLALRAIELQEWLNENGFRPMTHDEAADYLEGAEDDAPETEE